MCHAPLVRSRMRMRLSALPDASNRHNSTDSEDSENSEKLTPRPSQLAPRGNGNPAVCFDRSVLLEISDPRLAVEYRRHYWSWARGWRRHRSVGLVGSRLYGLWERAKAR